MRDDLGVEEFIQDVWTRVRSINRFEVTPYQVLVLSGGQRCLPPRRSPDGMLCRLLSAGDLRDPRSTADSREAPWRSEPASGGRSPTGCTPPVGLKLQPK